MHVYYELKDMLKKELTEIVKKGELSAGSLETVDKLLNSIKNACKIVMYEEYKEDGYSYADGDMGMASYAYARGRSRDGRYSRDGYSSDDGYSNEGGNSYERGRGSRGGYSRRGRYSYGDGKEEKVEMLREMMQEVSGEERMALQKIIRKMEQE